MTEKVGSSSQSWTFLAVMIVGISVVAVHVTPEQGVFGVSLSSLLGGPNVPMDIDSVNQRLQQLPIEEQPEALLMWANSTFPDQLAQFTSFGLSGIAITHMLSLNNMLSRTTVISIDTLHLFPSTYELMEQISDKFGLSQNLHVYRCRDAATRQEFELKYGPRLWRTDHSLYGYLTKVEPSKRALDELKVVAWITGRRRSQGGERGEMPLIEVDALDNRIKLNPMANWAHEDVWNYVKKAGLPYNSLHDEGYTSIGDVVSTEKASVEDGERAGRFKGQSSKECGMHLATSSGKMSDFEKKAARVRDGYSWDHMASQRAEAAGVIKVTEDNFAETVSAAGKGHLLLELYAPWCGHCQALEHVWNDVAAAMHAGEAGAPVRVGRMDRWQQAAPAPYADAFHVRSFPTVFLVREGQPGEPLLYSGEKSRKELVAFVRGTISQ